MGAILGSLKNVEVLTEEVPAVEEIMVEGETMIVAVITTIEVETTTIVDVITTTVAVTTMIVAVTTTTVAVTTTIVIEITIVAVTIMAMITEMGTIEMVVHIKIFHSPELKDRFSRIKSSNNFEIYKKVLVDYL